VADILILSADPLSDIQNLSKIEKVIKGGQVLNHQLPSHSPDPLPIDLDLKLMKP